MVVEFRARRAVATKVAALLIAIILVVVIVGAYFLYPRSAGPPTSASLSLESAPNANDAPIYYGVQQGIFSSEGVNVTVEAGKGTSGTIANVADGSVDFGLADTPGMIFAIANANITNVRIVAILYQVNFYAVFYNKAAISNISDLDGKSGALSAPSISTLTPMFDLFAKMNGLNLSSMQLQYSTSSLFTYLVAQGKVDFTTNKITNLPAIQAAAAESGIQVGDFLLSNYGINTYGEALLTTTQMIQQNPSLVQKMVTAVMKSMIAAEGDPTAAVSALVKAQPQLNYSLVLPGFELDLACCTKNASSSTDPLTFGYISPQEISQTVNFVVEGAGIRSVNASTIYTDEFTKPS